LFLDEVALASFSQAKAFPLLIESASILDGEQAIAAFIPMLQSNSEVSDI
jgi:hypothetical protein